MELKESTIRQYHALRRIALDQKGKPEGTSSGKIADRMLAKHPELAKTRDPDQQAPQPGRPPWAPYDGPRPTGRPSFRDLIRDIAEENGAQDAANLLDGVETMFPGLVDKTLMDFAQSLFGRTKGNGSSE